MGCEVWGWWCFHLLIGLMYFCDPPNGLSLNPPGFGESGSVM